MQGGTRIPLVEGVYRGYPRNQGGDYALVYSNVTFNMTIS